MDKPFFRDFILVLTRIEVDILYSLLKLFLLEVLQTNCEKDRHTIGTYSNTYHFLGVVAVSAPLLSFTVSLH